MARRVPHVSKGTRWVCVVDHLRESCSSSSTRSCADAGPGGGAGCACVCFYICRACVRTRRLLCCLALFAHHRNRRHTMHSHRSAAPDHFYLERRARAAPHRSYPTVHRTTHQPEKSRIRRGAPSGCYFSLCRPPLRILSARPQLNRRSSNGHPERDGVHDRPHEQDRERVEPKRHVPGRLRR